MGKKKPADEGGLKSNSKRRLEETGVIICSRQLFGKFQFRISVMRNVNILIRNSVLAAAMLRRIWNKKTPPELHFGGG
jgi:hypothetical protein